MKIEDTPFHVTEWARIEPAVHPGERGEARWRTRQCGNVRVRLVEYSPGYVADHWCERGHVLLVLEGEIVTELRDGRTFVIPAGSSYETSDSAGPEAHRSTSPKGARLFIVD